MSYSSEFMTHLLLLLMYMIADNNIDTQPTTMNKGPTNLVLSVKGSYTPLKKKWPVEIISYPVAIIHRPNIRSMASVFIFFSHGVFHGFSVHLTSWRMTWERSGTGLFV